VILGSRISSHSNNFFHVDNEPQQQLQAAPDMYDKELAKNATVF
jgi:hypothetical protein